MKASSPARAGKRENPLSQGGSSDCIQGTRNLDFLYNIGIHQPYGYRRKAVSRPLVTSQGSIQCIFHASSWHPSSVPLHRSIRFCLLRGRAKTNPKRTQSNPLSFHVNPHFRRTSEDRWVQTHNYNIQNEPNDSVARPKQRVPRDKDYWCRERRCFKAAVAAARRSWRSIGSTLSQPW